MDRSTVPYDKSISEKIEHVNRLSIADCRFSEIFKYTAEDGSQRIIKCLRPRDRRVDRLDRGDEDWHMMFGSEFAHLGGERIAGTPRLYARHSHLTVTTDSGESYSFDDAVEMEYIPGERLSSCRLGFDGMRKCAADMARTLLRANATGMYHIDVTPKNILVSFDGDGYVFTLIDFTGAWHEGCGYTPIHASVLTGNVPRTRKECVRAQVRLLLDMLYPYIDPIRFEDIRSAAAASADPISSVLEAIQAL